MRVEELEIGDWVSFKDEPSTVLSIESRENLGKYATVKSGTKIHDDEAILSFKPIRITPRILKENGFIDWEDHTSHHFEWKMNETDIHITLDSTDKDFCFISIYNKGIADFSTYKNKVHELQHAIRLCEIDKKFYL